MSRRQPNRISPILRALLGEGDDEFETAFSARRRLSGMEIATDPGNFRVTPDGIDVHSQSNRRKWYHCVARADEYACSCPDFDQHHRKCKHIYGAELHLYDQFLPEPRPTILFEDLADTIITVLGAHPEHRHLIRDMRQMMQLHRDLIRLNIYIIRGLINRSYVSDALEDFLTGQSSLDVIEREYGL